MADSETKCAHLVCDCTVPPHGPHGNIAATTANRRETKSSCAAIASIPLAAEWSTFGVGPSGFSVALLHES